MLKKQNQQERPMPMRPEIVDKYLLAVMNSQGGQTGQAAQIIKEIYELNVDNRILNNLKQQLNELIDDERSLISIQEFKKLFYMYFKGGESKSAKIYAKLLPFITSYLVDDEIKDEMPAEVEGVRPTFETMVSIQKLSKFIDIFNFYPIHIGGIRKKNHSDELTFIMTSNTRGNLAQ